MPPRDLSWFILMFSPGFHRLFMFVLALAGHLPVFFLDIHSAIPQITLQLALRVAPALALPNPEWPLHSLPSIHGRLFVAIVAFWCNSVHPITCAANATCL